MRLGMQINSILVGPDSMVRGPAGHSNPSWNGCIESHHVIPSGHWSSVFQSVSTYMFSSCWNWTFEHIKSRSYPGRNWFHVWPVELIFIVVDDFPLKSVHFGRTPSGIASTARRVTSLPGWCSSIGYGAWEGLDNRDTLQMAILVTKINQRSTHSS